LNNIDPKQKGGPDRLAFFSCMNVFSSYGCGVPPGGRLGRIVGAFEFDRIIVDPPVPFIVVLASAGGCPIIRLISASDGIPGVGDVPGLNGFRNSFSLGMPGVGADPGFTRLAVFDAEMPGTSSVNRICGAGVGIGPSTIGVGVGSCSAATFDEFC
jgi:hypothetical protein